ncbi:MAG: GHKL domain-containing protein, partial [Clostridia bacterium]|nr:GHKL domain-containing protein [Clostridia bacterium]
LLLDNAIKYSSHGGEIRLTMSSGKTKEIILTNPVDQIQQGNLSYLFDRFYRADSSRNSEGGGHGIGLSVAKAIVTAHKGKITAQSQDGKSIKFTINL